MESLDGPIRSRFRGLSWDKKHQGWRVRIYYAGKQRHVGRFDDDITAARAYDKAAVYLYGTNAITNFPLEVCLADHTEVSGFIILAMEQVDQEQLGRGQQRRYAEPCKASSASPVVHAVGGYAGAHSGRVIQPNLSTLQGFPQQQALYAATWQLQQQQQCLAPSAAMHQEMQQTWHPQCLQQTAPDQQMQYVVVAPQVALADTVSTASSTSNMVAFGNSSALNSSASTEYMACSNPCAQNVIAVPVTGYADATAAVMPAVPQQQILQPQQQPQQLLFFNSSSQPLQLSMQPRMTTIASHVTAPTASYPPKQQQQQQILLQQLSNMALPSLPYNPTSADCGDLQLGGGGQHLATAGSRLAASSMDMLLLKSAASGGIACAPMNTVGEIPPNLQAYPAVAGATAALQPTGLASFSQQQQHGLLVSSNSISSGMECNSSTCSPLVAPGRFPVHMTASAAAPTMVAVHANRSHIIPAVAGMQLSGSPTFSSTSSGSSKSKSCGVMANLVF
eukprot:GHUV01001050.1.p1 GENE.GHUV01001050.1~~GHUV01001050.1.p1  ORF type:complete len:558 (+),score=158.89 GHUV01001050.1:159-1676(+)